MRRSVSWCAQSRDSKATFNNNLMQTWHYTFGPHAPQTQVLCGFLNRPTAATVEDGLGVAISQHRHQRKSCRRRSYLILVDANILIYSHVESFAHHKSRAHGSICRSTLAQLAGFP